MLLATVIRSGSTPACSKREHAAGARKARLDLIGDQHDAVRIAQGAQAAQEFRRGDVEAAFALHRLDEDGRDARGLDVRLEQLLDGGQRLLRRDAVVGAGKRYMEYIRQQRAESGLVGLHLAGQRHGGERAAMEGAAERR